MSLQNVSSVNRVNFKGNQVESKENNTTQHQNNIKDGKKKLVLALAATGAIAAAGIGIAVAIKKGKNSGKEIEVVQGAVNKLQEAINDKATGTITTTLKNGDTLITELKDGKIISSERKGLVNFVKKYQHGENGVLKITTDFTDGTKIIFDRAADGSHKITENGIITKAMYNNKDTIVVNSFDKKYGILNGTNVFDKNTKEIARIAQSAASDAEKIRNSSPIHLLKDENITECTRYQNGKLKTATLKDGTKLEFDNKGHISKKIKPDGQVSTLRKTKDKHCERLGSKEIQDYAMKEDGFWGSSDAYCLEFPDGSKEFYDGACGQKSPYGHDILIGEYTADGTRKEYHSNGILGDIRKADGSRIEYNSDGQLRWGTSTSNHYRDNGTLDSTYFKEGSKGYISYSEDGITKLYETFADGSSKKY